MSKIISYKEFPFDWFDQIKMVKRKRGNNGGKTRYLLKDIVTAFDIETTAIPEIEQSVMYIWQWQFDTEYTVIGRSWKEFTKFCKLLKQHLKKVQLVVYVHNLSYEFQFLVGIYHFKASDVFAIDSRKVLKCQMFGVLQFRCSYIHSNMSLKMFLKNMKVEHQKLDGSEFDYTEQRYAWTKLTDRQLEYCVNDVLGLVEAIKYELEQDQDTLYTIPFTSTGYVRRDAKAVMKEVNHFYIWSQLPDIDTLLMLQEAFRGGNTHANRYYVNDILHYVGSADRSSSYPDVLCNCEFPVSSFFKYGSATSEEVLDMINVRHKAVLMRVKLYKVKLRDEYWGCPYLSISKCRNVKYGRNDYQDNGRIISADYLETTFTDVDFKIFLKEYSAEGIECYDVRHARYGYLPDPFVKLIIDYYHKKTSLKNVEGSEYIYMKSKNKLNSLYGMCVMNPIKPSLEFDGVTFTEDTSKTPEDLLKKYNKTAFLPYQWGVWCTAWARLRLEEAIDLVGVDAFVYTDTDSVKYRTNLDKVDFSKYNKDRIKASRQSGAYAKDPKGNTHYMGVLEDEGIYEEFSTMGAKKYVYRDCEKHELHCTIAGVSKKEGAAELEANGGIKAFAEGFIFRDAGGTESVYNDVPEIKWYNVQGHKVRITRNVYIRNSTYQLGEAYEYKQLLDHLENIRLNNEDD